MQLLNPRQLKHPDFDAPTREILQSVVDFFERKGKQAMKTEDHGAVWYTDFLDFIRESGFLHKFLTPSTYGGQGCRFDMARITAMSELLGFYSLSHWYTWQVSILGLGPFWMSANEEMKKEVARALSDGGVFGFGLSEKEHGADLIGTDMVLETRGDGQYVANGDKYYIGNGNCAAYVSVFAKVDGSKEFTFFAVRPDHAAYEGVQNVVYSQKYVAEFELKEYPITDAEILSRGRAAWDASLATVAYAKFNLGLAAVGICTHSFYEAINHAGNRRLYGQYVTDFPHIQQLFGEAYARLCAMRLFSYRAKDYMRVANQNDRRYLLFNPMVKMKVTMQGEQVIDLLWDVIAAKGFEKDQYFESATRDIRMLPKLEGTAHVNMVLVIKFMQSFLFDATPVSDVPSDNGPGEELFLFAQGATTKGQDKVQFGNWRKAYEPYAHLPNVSVFLQQSEQFRSFLSECGPDASQLKDLDFMLTVGEIFTLIAYGSLILEQAAFDKIDADLIDSIFEFQVRDFSKHALNLYQKRSVNPDQQTACQKMMQRAIIDTERANRLHTIVMQYKDMYRMND